MSWLCVLFGHDYQIYEIDPHKEKDCGYQKICKRCDEFGEKVRPAEWEENTTEIEWEEI